MPWDGRTADSVWLKCFDCPGQPSFREPDYRRHIKDVHVDRPEADAMTTSEVAKALGVGRRQALCLVKKGAIRGFTVGANPRHWVRRKDLKRYVREQMETHPEKAVTWAATGVLS